MEIPTKTAKDLQQLFLKKTLSQKFGRVSNTYYKIVVRKFTKYKLKQKRAKKAKK